MILLAPSMVGHLSFDEVPEEPLLPCSSSRCLSVAAARSLSIAVGIIVVVVGLLFPRLPLRSGGPLFAFVQSGMLTTGCHEQFSLSLLQLCYPDTEQSLVVIVRLVMAEAREG